MSAGDAQPAGRPGDNAQIWGELGARPSFTARGVRTGPALAVAPTGLGEHEGKKLPQVPAAPGASKEMRGGPASSARRAPGTMPTFQGRRSRPCVICGTAERVSRMGGPAGTRLTVGAGISYKIRPSGAATLREEASGSRLPPPPAGDKGIRVCNAAPAPGHRDQHDRWAWGHLGNPRPTRGAGFLVEPKENSPPEVRRTLPSKAWDNKHRCTLGTPSAFLREVGVTVGTGVGKPSCVFHKGRARGLNSGERRLGPRAEDQHPLRFQFSEGFQLVYFS